MLTRTPSIVMVTLELCSLHELHDLEESGWPAHRPSAKGALGTLLNAKYHVWFMESAATTQIPATAAFLSGQVSCAQVIPTDTTKLFLFFSSPGSPSTFMEEEIRKSSILLNSFLLIFP